MSSLLVCTTGCLPIYCSNEVSVKLITVFFYFISVGVGGLVVFFISCTLVSLCSSFISLCVVTFLGGIPSGFTAVSHDSFTDGFCGAIFPRRRTCLPLGGVKCLCCVDIFPGGCVSTLLVIVVDVGTCGAVFPWSLLSSSILVWQNFTCVICEFVCKIFLVEVEAVVVQLFNFGSLFYPAPHKCGS